MPSLIIRPAYGLRGTVHVPGDKSISHRAVMLSAIARGTTRLSNMLMAEDCVSTIKAFRQMGVPIQVKGEGLRVKGVGLEGLKAPTKAIDCGNSGTTMRLLLGILAGRPFRCRLIGDASLSSRPMRRVAEPLRRMGACITGQGSRVKGEGNELYPPLTIQGGPLRAIEHRSSVASAQVKSAVLLAGLAARGATHVAEPVLSRDHTERMLKCFGVPVRGAGGAGQGARDVSVRGPATLRSPRHLTIPGDMSSAAFFIVAALIVPGSRIRLVDVGLNPTRTGLLDVLKSMGARITTVQSLKFKVQSKNWEPRGDIIAESSVLKGTTVEAAMVPRLIDELPILMVAAAYARGVSVFRGVSELRVKETDRLRSMTEGLRAMGAGMAVWRDAFGDCVVITGGRPLHGARVKSYGDHRTAMGLAVAGLAAQGRTVIQDTACIATSFPTFSRCLRQLQAGQRDRN